MLIEYYTSNCTCRSVRLSHHLHRGYKFVIIRGKNIPRKHQSVPIPEQPRVWKPNVISTASCNIKFLMMARQVYTQTASDLF